MKTYTDYIYITSERKIEILNITNKVDEIIQKSLIKNGLVLVNAMHVTASVFINDAEKGLLKDFEKWLEKLASKESDYEHNKTGETNGYAHHWRMVMGREVVVALKDGNMEFGPWEQIFYGEFDGQRRKRILVHIIGE